MDLAGMVELDSVENDQDAVAEAQEGFEGDRLAAQGRQDAQEPGQEAHRETV